MLPLLGETLEILKRTKQAIENITMKTASTPGSERHDTWLRLWQDVGRGLGKRGEYDRADKTLDVWGQFANHDSIEVSTDLNEWPVIAKEVRDKKFTIGMVAVRLAADDLRGSPGVTFVVETPRGGSIGARILLNLLSSLGIGGVLARQEGRDRYGVVKLIYCPNWYAVTEDKIFGIDWSRRSDEGESKRLWCEHVGGAVKRIKKEMPSALLDSLFFDCYAACDRLHELSDDARNKLADVDTTSLAEHLTALQAGEK